jgi:hypothetical protein
MFTLQRIIISIVAVAFIMGSAGIAFADTNDSKDMNSFICKDIMRLSGENRDIAMAFVHGYFLGKKGSTTYKTDKLAAATDEFIETCLDNPNANALKTMGDILKK